MNTFFAILISVFLVPFWAAVLSFVPVVIALILNPLYSIRAEKALEKRIFLLKEQSSLNKEKKKRLRVVFVIYGTAFWLVTLIGLINWIYHGTFSIQPFDIVSSLSTILLFFAIASYLPFAAYLMIKDPWKYKEEGAIFTRIFIIYGVSIFLFCILYSATWVKGHDIFFGLGDFLKSFFVIFISSVCLAYLPTMAYVFFKIKNPFRPKSVNLRVVFIIYCVGFLLFSGVYIINWRSDRLDEILQVRIPCQYPQGFYQI